MKLYKKVLLTLSGAGMLTACTSDTSYQGIVIEKKESHIFLDANNDGLADQMFQGLQYGSVHRAMYKYIIPGDTVVWKPGNAWNGPYHPDDIKTVNGLTKKEIFRLVEMRQAHNGKIR
ncbi:MAG: hypothetical protein J6L70_00740 [Alphaproteobacteria bacterium]|nr:hypothetical protein [Alphaproteobacteria bacterium]